MKVSQPRSHLKTLAKKYELSSSSKGLDFLHVKVKRSGLLCFRPNYSKKEILEMTPQPAPKPSSVSSDDTSYSDVSISSDSSEVEIGYKKDQDEEPEEDTKDEEEEHEIDIMYETDESEFLLDVIEQLSDNNYFDDESDSDFKL